MNFMKTFFPRSLRVFVFDKFLRASLIFAGLAKSLPKGLGTVELA
jgi:hypothetical protein